MGFAIDKIGANAPVFKGLGEKEEDKKKTAYASSPISIFQGQSSGTQEASGFLG